MDEVKSKTPESPGKEELDGAILSEMMMTGENQKGMFTPNDPELPNGEDPHREIDEKYKPKFGKVTAKHGEYKKKFLKDMSQHPERYEIDTPKGKMTITKAMQLGYDPITKDFTGTSIEGEKEKAMAGLSPEDKLAISRITSQEKPEPKPEAPVEQQLPLGQMPQGQPTPQPEGAAPAAGAPDIMSLLGGGK